MKRFIIDSILFIIFICFSFYVFNQDQSIPYEKTIIYNHSASTLALKCSKFIVEMIRLFFHLFYILITQWIG